MLALYRSGRPSDALRVFSRLREALDRELGMEPGAAVRQLETSIVVQGRELDLPRGAPRRLSPPVPEILPLAGRRSELAAIERAWAGLTGARPGLVVVTGAAGIGKTALVETACARLEEGGARVITGSCDPEPSSDYEPVPQLVRAALKLVDARRRCATRSSVSSVCSSPRRPPASRASHRRRRRRRAGIASSPRSRPSSSSWQLVPTVIVAEDLHWAGADAVRAAAPRALELPRVGSSSSRPTATTRSRDAPAAEALAHGRFAKPDLVVSLDGLDIAELGALVRSVASEDLRDRLLGAVDELADLTAGNPMFVREVLREVTASPIPIELDTMAPDGVRTLVERRLDRLSPIARSMLSVAAVLGREFSVALLAETADVTELAVLDALDTALRARLVYETDEIDHFAFQRPARAQHDQRDDQRQSTGPAPPASRRDPRVEIDARTRERRRMRPPLPGGSPARRRRARGRVLRARSGSRSVAFASRYADAIAWHERALDLADEAGWSHHQHASALLELGEALELEGERRERPGALPRGGRARPGRR